MSRAALQALTRELGSDLPEAFAVLDEGDVLALTAALRVARQQQKAQLDEALTRALEHVPALMRGPVRRILGL
jgi:hypothetical protein